MIFVLRIDHHRVVLVRIGATHERNAELVPVVGGLYGERDVVAGAQAVEEHVGIVAREGAIVVAVGSHHVDIHSVVVLCSHCRHSAEGKNAVGVLDELVANQCARPVGLVAIATAYADVLLVNIGTRTEWTPTPDVAVGAVRSCLAGIEGAGVEDALVTIGWPFGTIIEAVLQLLVGWSYHVLHLAAPACANAFAIYAVPVVAQLEDVGALEHTVPDHPDASYVLPVLHVVRLELCEAWVATPFGIGGDNHVEETVFGNEDLRVAEVVGRIAELRTIDLPEFVLRPGLEVGGCGTHHHLAVLAVAVVAGVVDVVGAVLPEAAAGAEGGILCVVVAAVGEDFAQGLIVGTIDSRNCPDGVEAMAHIVVELLQVEHLEVACLWVEERHGVANASDGWLIVGVEACVVGGSEEGSAALPIPCRIAIELFVTASRQHQC